MTRSRLSALFTAVLLGGLALGLLAGCASEPASVSPEDYPKVLRTQLIEAEPGDVIEVPAGTFAFDRSLTLNVDGVTLKGAGMGESILSFKGQIQGAEGLLVNASDFTIEDLAIEDTKGDALKVNEGTNIVIRNVRTEWTGGPSTDNGSYGIYPVQTTNLLVEGSVAIGASDAGIYVGQSENVIVRGNRAELNVAGIEIENTTRADVYDNVAVNNTGGILVFNMPDLPVPGHSTRVFRNEIHDNNTDNFAPPGTAVASVPAGSGVVINSNDKVEVFENRIADNKTANVIISSYFSTGYYGNGESAEAYDPYPETLYIYGNEFSGGGNAPALDFVDQARIALFGEDGSLPDVLWDGFVNPEKSEDGKLLPEYSICIDNGEAGILNVDSQHENQNPSTDMAPHRCSHEKLPPVSLSGGLAEFTGAGAL